MKLSCIKSFFLVVFSFLLTMPLHAAQTECNNNGGAGWTITDFGTTNLSIPFSFGDISRAFDVKVTTDITHTWVGDLRVDAQSPGGSSVTLFDRPGTLSATGSPFGCSGDNLLVTFDDASGNPPIENEPCGNLPAFSGSHQSHTNNLSDFDGQDLNGNWAFTLTDNANQDLGTLNEICMTSSFAGVTFDVWVSSNAACSDTIDTMTIAPGTQVYYCYIVENPGDVAFIINPGASNDDKGVDISSLEHTYAAGSSDNFVYGPVTAGSAELPTNTTTVHNADVTATFSSPGFTGNLFTDEVATITVADPIFSTSTKAVVDQNGGAAVNGDVLRYTITINETAGSLTQGVQLLDVVDANLNSISIVSLPSGAVDNSSGNSIDITNIEVPAGGSVTVVFDATIAAGTPPATAINNSATIQHAPSGVTAVVTAPTIITAVPDISTSTKTVVDLNGGSALPGDILRYTVTITETAGFAVSNVQVTDALDGVFNALSVVSIPAGATDNTAGTSLDISAIAVPASGSVTVVFDATIHPAAAAGSSVPNTAVVTDLSSGVSVNPVAPTLTVGGAAASGSKYLYFNELNNGNRRLSRVAPTANTNSPNINPFGASYAFNQTLVFQSPFTISAGDVNIYMNLQRRGGGGNRTVEMRLQKVSGGTVSTLGTDSITFNAGNFYAAYQITLGADVSFAAGDYIRLLVVNNTATNNRRVRVRSLRNGNASRIQMQSSTVINVDTVGVYAQAYPSSVQLQSYLPGDEVFIRAQVSDPFGSADITAGRITVSDSTAAVRVNDQTMTEVDTPTSSTKIYEYWTTLTEAYTLPASPEGFWQVAVTADEGDEGEVSHTNQATMIVGRPSISVTKSSFVVSDPFNGVSAPKAIPGAIVEYTVQVTNSGFGYAGADSVFISDMIPAESVMVFGSPADPVQFTDGAVSSGLSFNFSSLSSGTDDVDFSSDGGTSFLSPSADAGGFDISSPAVNHIRVNPKGVLRGSDGVSHPGFSFKFRTRLD